MYRIFIDYRTEGWALQDDKFEDLTMAVKKAQEMCYGNPFLIVKIVDWEVSEVIEK